MKKTVIFIFSIVMSLMLLVGCNNYNQKPIGDGPNASDPVTNNSSFIVSKGDFYYYINGKANQSDSNKFGAPIKGAIVRTKKADLFDNTKHVTIVPKIALNSYSGAGFSILGDYIYYTSPNDQKNKDGDVEYTYLDFMRTKLDGTDTQKILTHASSALQHKYYYVDNTPYLAYVDTVESVTKVFTINCTTKAKKEIVKEFTGTAYFLNDKVVVAQNVYRAIISKEENETMTSTEQTEKSDEFEIAPYNKVSYASISSGENTLAKKDKGYKYAITSAESYDGGSYVFYTETGASVGGSKTSVLKRTNDSLDFATATVVSVSNTALTGFISMGEGMGYIFQDTSTIKWVVPRTTGTIEKPIVNLTGTTLLKVMAGKLYYFDSTAELYSLTLPAATWIEMADTSTWLDSKKERVMIKDAQDKMDTTWLKPVYMDEKWFFFNSGTDAFDKTKEDTDHVSMFFRSGYIFVFDTTVTTEDYIAQRIGTLKTADKDSEAERIKEENETRDKKKEKESK